MKFALSRQNVNDGKKKHWLSFLNCHLHYELMKTFLAGKTGKGGAKNKKADPSTTKQAKKGFTIPKNAPLLELDSDDEELGQPLEHNKFLKFDHVKNSSIKNVLNTSSLLSKETSSMSQDLERLIM